jgi:hypothetical protein
MDISLFARLEPLISNGMSIFQMEKFVITDQLTPVRRLRQAFIEGRSRLEARTSKEFEIEEMQIKRQMAESALESLSGFELQLKQLDIKRYDFTLNRMRLSLDQLGKEADFFLSMTQEIIDKDFGGIDSCISKLSDPNFYLPAEEDFWTEKLSRSVFADLVNFGTITKGLSESISCLTLDQQKLIYAKAVEQQETLGRMLEATRDNLLAQRD